MCRSGHHPSLTSTPPPPRARALPARRGTLAALKRAQQEADEWAKIYEMHIRVRRGPAGHLTGGLQAQGPPGTAPARQGALPRACRASANSGQGRRGQTAPVTRAAQEGKDKEAAGRAKAALLAAQTKAQLAAQAADKAAAAERERREAAAFFEQEQVGRVGGCGGALPASRAAPPAKTAGGRGGCSGALVCGGRGCGGGGSGVR